MVSGRQVRSRRFKRVAGGGGVEPAAGRLKRSLERYAACRRCPRQQWLNSADVQKPPSELPPPPSKAAAFGIRSRRPRSPKATTLSAAPRTARTAAALESGSPSGAIIRSATASVSASMPLRAARGAAAPSSGSATAGLVAAAESDPGTDASGAAAVALVTRPQLRRERLLGFLRRDMHRY